ncbi:heme-dependent oxidative N-demethylase family protein [Allorhizobium sp. NPDC080224]|uniref:heme-dependent oxidative N-demethylase family protein n=1 Tax=Allorhizobium sp. NPDC080224 TaxID=3390547 RepID=UPI003D054301
MPFTHTPYAGATRPFTIGLSALDPRRWIEPDAALGRYLTEKQELARTRLGDVFRATDDSLEAQRECFAALLAHLAKHQPGLYRRKHQTIHVAGHTVDLADEAVPPLLRAGMLVQDDLVIMMKREAGWSIAAAHLSFPSSWSLAEKFDRPMEAVHEHVPGFQGGTRNAAMINRIFDNLAPGLPAERFNWSINWKEKLFHPETGRNDAAKPDEAVVRVERQTLTKLPETGAIVFTIRIYLDPVTAFRNHPDGPRLRAALAEQLEGLANDQLRYKGLDIQRKRLVAYLRQDTALENQR